MHLRIRSRNATVSPRIAIACCIDEQYALPLATMLTSLTARLGPGCEPTVHLLHRRLDRDVLDALSGIVDIREIRLGGGDLERLPHSRTFPPEAAAPLLLPDVLPPDLERVIFLDADLLVLDDISGLWTRDLSGRALAAVVDPSIPWCRSPRGVKGWRDRGIQRTAAYFNAGVLVVDLESWRRRDMTGRALEYIREVGDGGDFLHQEALNAVAWDDWLPLEARWNVPATAGRWFDPTTADALAEPAIVHFAGRMKPWRMPSGSRFAAAYADALARVSSRFPRPACTRRDRWLGFYDRHMRPACHPLERWLWARRLI